MAPMYGLPNYNFVHDSSESNEYEDKNDEDKDQTTLTEVTFWYMIVLISMLLIWLILFFCLRIFALRQKTRNPQQRRMYAASRARPSLSQAEPTIYVSPANLPPPPKYEALAPPSYEEVVGVHYPNYQVTQIQPITQPITTAMAQIPQVQQITQPITTAMVQSTLNATDNTENNVNVRNNDVPATVITVTTEQRRTSVAVAQS